MKILFIQTGGTIDKAYPKSNKGYAFEIDSPAFERILKKVKVGIDYETLSLFQKDSLEIIDDDRLALKNLISKTELEKIIITHGSDTLIETAQFVGNIAGKTCVFTAALTPEVFKETDADFNLGCAIGTVQLLNGGTYIAMNGQVFTPDNCRKNKENGKFESIHE